MALPPCTLLCGYDRNLCHHVAKDASDKHTDCLLLQCLQCLVSKDQHQQFWQALAWQVHLLCKDTAQQNTSCYQQVYDHSCKIENEVHKRRGSWLSRKLHKAEGRFGVPNAGLFHAYFTRWNEILNEVRLSEVLSCYVMNLCLLLSTVPVQ